MRVREDTKQSNKMHPQNIYLTEKDTTHHILKFGTNSEPGRDIVIVDSLNKPYLK